MKHEKVGQKIRYYRNRIRMTQQQLADKVGITWEMISRYERGNSSPMEKVSDIAKALDINVTELVEDNDDILRKGLIISAENLIPLFTKTPKDKKFVSKNTQYFHTVSEWVLKLDKDAFAVDPGIAEIKSERIVKDGPLFIAPNAEPTRSSIVLAFEHEKLFIDSMGNFSAGATVIGVVVGQEIRFV